MALNKEGEAEERPFDMKSLRVDGGDIRIDTPETPLKLLAPPREPEYRLAPVTDSRRRAVVVEGVQHQYGNSVLRHLENRNGGSGHWERHHLDYEKLIFVFTHFEDAQAVLRQKRLEIDNETFGVSPLPDDYPLPSYLNDPYSLHSTWSEALSSSSSSQKLDTIKVFDVPEDLTTDDLELYFEDRILANGGPTKSVKRIPEKRQAIIKYKEPKDAVAVARKGIHNFMDQSIMAVVLLESELDLPCHAVQVSGIDWHKIKEEILKMYFRNKYKSGGGDIVEIMPDKELGRAIIAFASGEDAQNVVERGKTSGHTLKGIPLHVEIIDPWSTLLPAFEDETEPNRLIVRGLYFRITLSKLTEYVETVTRCRVVGWSLSSKQCSAMLEFDGEPDYEALRRRVNCFPFCGHMIGIQRMPLTTFIQVSNLSPTETVDSVVDYFERWIGDQQFLRCEQKTESSVILQFQSNSVVQRIHSQTHILRGRTLKLDPWSKELERLLPVNASRHPVENCPQMMKILCTQFQLFCIQNSSFIREDIERKLRDNDCIVTWPSAAEDLDVRLQLAEDSLKEDQLWPDKCRSILQKCLADLFCEKFALLSDKWIKTKEIIEDNFGLICEFDEGKCEVSVCGYRQSVKECVKRMKEMEDEIERQLDREEELKRRKSDVLTSLRPHQIQYIRVAGIVDEMKSLLPEVTVETDNQKVSLLGRKEDLNKAKLHIYESLNNVDSKFISLTESLTELITTEPTAESLRDYFAQKQMRIIILRSQEKPGIIVYGIEDDLRNAEKFLISQFVESSMEANDAVKDATQSSEWPEFVDALKEDYRFVIIKPTTDACIVACRSYLLDSIKQELDKMFQKYTTVELFFSLKSSHAELLNRQVELEKSILSNCEGGVEVKQVLKADGTSDLTIKGWCRDAESVRDVLKTMAEKEVLEDQLEMDEPGVMTLMCSSEGNEFVKGLKDKDLVILRMAVSESTASSTPSVHRRSEIEEGHEIILELGDIMRSTSNAIVNPCNSFIDLSRGHGSEIVCRGGQGIEKECIDHIKDHGIPFPDKFFFVSKAEKLLCDVVIHVVEPEPTAFGDSAVNIYKSAVESVLFEAVRRNFDCVVFPLHFGVAFKRHLLFSTIKEFFQKNSTTVLKSIKFCNDNEEVLVEFEKQLKHYELSVLAAAAAAASESLEADAEFSVMTPEGVLVRLFKGSICDLKVDAIVNSTSKDLSLGYGEISRTILMAAGTNIQKECKANFPKGLDQVRRVVRTKSHKMTNCKAVYHGAAVKWDDDPNGESITTLRAIVSETLKQADSDGMTSIAFPAIGSGTLKIPHDIVANTLLDEIVKFSKSSPNTSLKIVFTVAFDKTQPSIDAFEKKYKELESKCHLQFDEDSQDAIRSKLLRTYDENVSFTITSFSRRVMQETQDRLRQFIAGALDKKTFPIQNAFTEEQLERIKFLQTIHCVRFALSSSEIIIEGLKSDVIRATEELRFIMDGS